MVRSRKPISKHRRNLMNCTLGLLNERGKEIAANEKILTNNKKPFLKEYRKLCRKYRCYVDSLGGSFVSSQRKGEKISTITKHLRGLSQ